MNKTILILLALPAAGCTSTNYNELEFGQKLFADPETGEFRAALSPSGRFCYELSGPDDTIVAAAHIHHGNRQQIAVELVTPQPGKRAEACTRIDRELASDLLANPGRYLLDIHSDGLGRSTVRSALRGNEAG